MQHQSAVERLEAEGPLPALAAMPTIPLLPSMALGTAEPCNLEQLNCWMPPVRYRTGGRGVAEAKCLAVRVE